MPADRPHNIFRSLDAKGCRDIYPKLRKNADRHFKAAGLLGNAGDYANSVAHLILGSEELVKCFVLVLQAYDFPVKKIANYDKLFTHHVSRHNLLKEFYSIYRFVRGIVDWPAWNKNQHFLLNISKVLGYGVDILNQSVQNHEWWNEADKMKQNCFYLDYNSNGVADPTTINQKDLETANNLAQKFRADLRLMIIIIQRSSAKDLASLKESFIASGMVEQIDESIVRKK